MPPQSPLPELSTSLLIGFYVSHILEWLKSQRWCPLVKHGAADLNRFTAWLAAILTGLGMHWAFAHGVDGWQVTLGGPQTSALALLTDILQQYAIQKVTYDKVIGYKAPVVPTVTLTGGG